jgi:hypothetical protein
MRRSAHNPEVAGSNPAPATKARGPLSNRERASCLSFVNGFVHGGSLTSRLRRLSMITPGTSFAAQAADGLPLRHGVRMSAINCR